MAEQSFTSGKRMIRRLRRYLLHYILLAIFCLAIAFVMCYTVFFKLEKVKINGCTHYSNAQIIDEIDAEKGESLFHINISNAEKKILGKLPYVRSVNIKRRFPTTLQVDIQEEELLGAVYTEEGFALISTMGKVLETKVLALPEGTPRIIGLPAQVYEAGSYLKESSKKNAELISQVQILQKVHEELKANHFTDITYYDVTDVLGLQVLIEDKLLLKLGTQTDLDYKLSFIHGVLEKKKLGDKEFENVPEEGILDFSSPPALHTRTEEIDKIRNREALLDFGFDAVTSERDNVAGGQKSESIQLPDGSVAPNNSEATQQNGQAADSQQPGTNAATQIPQQQTPQGDNAANPPTQPPQNGNSGMNTVPPTPPQANTAPQQNGNTINTAPVPPQNGNAINTAPQIPPQVNTSPQVPQNGNGVNPVPQTPQNGANTVPQIPQNGNGMNSVPPPQNGNGMNTAGQEQQGVFNNPTHPPIVN